MSKPCVISYAKHEHKFKQLIWGVRIKNRLLNNNSYKFSTPFVKINRNNFINRSSPNASLNVLKTIVF